MIDYKHLLRTKHNDNREVVLQAVTSDGNLLQFASQRLKDEKAVVYEAIKNGDYAFRYASDRLKDDSEFVYECSLVNWKIYYYVSNRLKVICDNYFDLHRNQEPEPQTPFRIEARRYRAEILNKELAKPKTQKKQTKI